MGNPEGENAVYAEFQNEETNKYFKAPQQLL